MRDSTVNICRAYGIAVSLLLAAPLIGAEPVRLASPDGRWSVLIEEDPQLELQMSDAKRRVFLTQEIGLTLQDGRALLRGRPKKVSTRAVDQEVRPVAPTKMAVLRDRYNAATLDFTDGFSLEVRAYNDGIAYRFATSISGPIVVAAEKQVNTFAADPLVRMCEEKSFLSHNEVSYSKQLLSHAAPGMLTSLPILVHAAGGGPRMVFSESALEAYPGLWLRVGAGAKSLEGVWPAYPLEEEMQTNPEGKADRDVAVTGRAADIARTQGTRTYPWRFVAIGATDGELLLNTLSYLLADPARIADTAWIKPGKVQWDWWHDFNVWDTDFTGGVSQALYEHYIDFAARNNARYIILDEGWYPLGDPTRTLGDIDISALVAYGKTKNVGLILWASWATLRKQFDVFMPLAQEWGIAGLKVDFFQRDDQPVVEFYWKLAKEAAERKLLLDFHGAHKPAGLQRTYPNVLTVEGVKGLEHVKWSAAVTPEHDTTLPFVRQVAGPMDYTPGAMDNAQEKEFRPSMRRPMSQGTRAHQLALYVVYESPLQMYADSPSAYRREEASMKFLREVPVVWDETRVLAAEVGHVVALARRSGKRWFIGVVNGEGARTLELDWSFLPKTNTTLAVWKDGPNAARDGRDVQYLRAVERNGNKVEVNLAPGGGWVAIADEG